MIRQNHYFFVRRFALSLLLVLMLLISGCASRQSSPNDDSSSAQETTAQETMLNIEGGKQANGRSGMVIDGRTLTHNDQFHMYVRPDASIGVEQVEKYLISPWSKARGEAAKPTVLE
jgi:PBP1b-binding outer membrane lipoprotein LpoB